MRCRIPRSFLVASRKRFASMPLTTLELALQTLAREGIDFLVVGVGGINFYAPTPADAVVTQDLDVFLRPNVDTLGRALRALAREGFSFWSAGEPFVDLDDEPILANVLRMTSNLVAERDPDEPTGGRIDLMVEMASFPFDVLHADAAAFRLGDVTILVAPLEKLLEAKEIAGRQKDIDFLRMHAARFRDYAKPKRKQKPAKNPKKKRPKK